MVKPDSVELRKHVVAAVAARGRWLRVAVFRFRQWLKGINVGIIQGVLSHP
jgi:hypothetical protein